MPPTSTNGKIWYIEMPTTDIGGSAEFYKRVFGWNVRTRGKHSVTFRLMANDPGSTLRLLSDRGAWAASSMPQH